MVTAVANSAATPVTFPIVSKEAAQMSREQFMGEKKYRVSIVLARQMLEKGIISEKDYCKIDTMLKAKYKPIIGGL